MVTLFDFQRRRPSASNDAEVVRHDSIRLQKCRRVLGSVDSRRYTAVVPAATNSTYDAIIIGTGQAGPPLAKRLSQAGMSVAIIERHQFGGTCVNTGCTPTKTLVASAYAARLAHRAGDYGVAISGDISVDMKKVKARKDAVSGTSSRNVEKWLKGLANCTVLEGHARFESPTSTS